MKTILTVLLTAFLLYVAGCASVPGDVKLSSPQLTVSLGDKVMARPEKVSMITKHHGVEQLHTYLVEKFARGKIRNSLLFDVTVSEFRVGWGRDFMAANVVVTEDGKELKRFKSIETTGRRHPVERMVKGLARRIYKEVEVL
jgi:hypothetical protein